MARAQFNTRSPFDAFLFAPIGEDSKGLIVSVLSALARLDFDPWQEAAVFARLPKEAAQARLTRMIADLPNASPLQAEPGTIATQVLALLPDRPEPTAVPDATATARNSTTVLRPAGLLVALGPTVLLIASAVVFALWSASIITMASQQVPTAKASQVDARGGNRPDAARVPLPAATGMAAAAGAGRATDGRGTSTTEAGDGGDAHARTDMPAASGPATRSIISPH
ncbi:unnamed protein product [Acidocella sp. C78]|uniref:hypothetical protein n=1 Tax=Acidocella sp. C78 TaxID=1671486 RepID=UPI00191B9115|nr:hypothetical protein [Acidocella sp. C78]CAG4901038.1 unnamed protein product [Acidocella sp. C78]